MWNEWLRARLPCNHSLANVRRSAIDSAPPLSTAQGVCLPVLTVAYALPSESSARARARSQISSEWMIISRGRAPRNQVFSRQQTELRRSLLTNAHPGGCTALSLAIDSAPLESFGLRKR